MEGTNGGVLPRCLRHPRPARQEAHRSAVFAVPIVAKSCHVCPLLPLRSGPVAVYASLPTHSKFTVPCRSITTDFLTHSADETHKRLKWLLELESRPWTLNEESYSHYADAFYAHYRGWRPKASSASDPRASFTSRLNDQRQVEFHRGLNEVMSGLARMEINGVRKGDVANLLEGDQYETALNIMAVVRAYFQGARLLSPLASKVRTED